MHSTEFQLSKVFLFVVWRLNLEPHKCQARHGTIKVHFHPFFNFGFDIKSSKIVFWFSILDAVITGMGHDSSLEYILQ